MKYYDKIIIGGGLYGLYSALYCGKKGEKVLLLEYEEDFFTRATYINQARVHMGYHYPRSYSTAIKSAGYFQRFMKDYGFCVNSEFEKIYATSQAFSYTNREEFKKFCDSAVIPCEEISPSKYFNPNTVDGAFLCEEYTYDAHILLEHILHELRTFENVELSMKARIEYVEKGTDTWKLKINNNGDVESPFVLNATYASVNQILEKFGQNFELFKIKYELCEIILCKTNHALKDKGITVMDGPFFSIMPFGKTGYHSLTSVSFTPHYTSYDKCPTFKCQESSQDFCTSIQLGNCNDCIAKPISAWPYMSALARNYLKQDFKFEYAKSLFSMKPILMASEIDDSRPTVVKVFSKSPTFISVLSGKINTVYDMDRFLDGDFE
nr:FAD-dependent oxidoreductase [uncultured Faecalimonas sp.]